MFLYRSKIFIRFPKTLFSTEDALETRKHSLGKTQGIMTCITDFLFLIIYNSWCDTVTYTIY